MLSLSSLYLPYTIHQQTQNSIQPVQHVCLCGDLPRPSPSCSSPCKSTLAPHHFTQTRSLALHRLQHLSQLQIFPTTYQHQVCQKLFYINLWQKSSWCWVGGDSIFTAFCRAKGKLRILKVRFHHWSRVGKNRTKKWLYNVFKLPTHGMHSACVFRSAYYFLWVTFSCALAVYFSQSDLSWNLCYEEVGGVQICSSILEFAPLSVVTQYNPTELNWFCVPFPLS